MIIIEKTLNGWTVIRKNDVFMRSEEKTADHMIVGIFNFSDKEQKDYKLTIKGHHTRRTLLHTEWEQYGGTMKKRKENIHLKKKEKTVSLRSHFQDTVEFIKTSEERIRQKL